MISISGTDRSCHPIDSQKKCPRLRKMRIDAQIMWVIIVFASLVLPTTTGGRYRTRRKRLQPQDVQLMARLSGGEGPGCGAASGETKKPSRPPVSAKQRASGIAMQAANEAKKANEDMATAVKVAADKIKTEYADKATAAAKAAEAVLSGKAQVLEQLEAEVREAESVVQEENQEFITADANAQLAIKAHKLGQEELKMMTMALRMAKENRDTSDQVYVVWQQSLADKTALLEAAQRRVGVLMRQLSEARMDYEKTKKAALNAARAAEEAKHRIEQLDPNSSCNQRIRRWQHREGH
ncbi:uncharacterized protein LOC108092048 [Drosophila ficusphila]|uniref:uncharacterized protein LOC108092048 n=1 Tax=Drosophila ficusphila TaxID=30025 RepID=UPI0007E85F61|nr:uncharacterized protein LOC108092048 [Drosophila ficusphila]